MRISMRLLILAVILFLGRSTVFAGINDSIEDEKYGLETSPILPFAKIYALQLTCSVWRKGDVVLGYAYQNEIIKNEGQCHGHTVLLGYRQYFWKGLHLDFELFPAINDFYSYSDKTYYEGFEVVAEIRPGYRFDINMGGANDLYVLAQMSMLFGIYRDNPWPDMSSEPYFFPILWFGICI